MIHTVHVNIHLAGMGELKFADQQLTLLENIQNNVIMNAHVNTTIS